MLDLTNIHSLSDFQRNAKSYLQRLKETGEPEILTVNGKAEVVVQDATAYQKLIEDAEAVRTLQAIRVSFEEAKRGNGRPMREFLAELAASVGIIPPQ